MTQRAAKEKLIKQYCKNRAWCELYGEHCKKENCEIYHAIKALDAEPIKHGRWLPSKDGHGCECSECGTPYGWIEADTMRYCKRCGAKMDEVKND